jgi:hypothetical protein
MNTNEEKEREAFELKYPMNPRLFWDGKRYSTIHSDAKTLQWMFIQQGRFEGWKAGRAALRAESAPVYQMYDLMRGTWWECDKEYYESAITPDKRILYTAPQTEPKVTGSEI